MDFYCTWVQLLHLCLPQVPLTRNPDPWSEFGLRGNQTFSLPWWNFQGSHIFPYFLPCLRPRYVSFIPVCKKKRRANQKIEGNVDEVKKKFTFFVCGQGGITNPLKTPAHQVQDYIGGRGTFVKRGQKWNSPKLILFHKCFRAQRGRISCLLPKCAGQNYVTWHALHDCTETWFACGGKWNCYSYKFKFFIHFLLEVFPRNFLRSSMDS